MKLAVVLLAGWLATTSAACSPLEATASSQLSVDLVLDPSPPREGPVTLELTLADGSGARLEGASVEVEGNMNHAGMVPELARAEEVAPGDYRADIEFTMGGDWFVVVRATAADGRRLENTVQIPGVEAGP